MQCIFLNSLRFLFVCLFVCCLLIPSQLTQFFVSPVTCVQSNHHLFLDANIKKFVLPPNIRPKCVNKIQTFAKKLQININLQKVPLASKKSSVFDLLQKTHQLKSISHFSWQLLLSCHVSYLI